MEIGLLLLLSAAVYFLKIYFLMLIARILLYWFPNISFYDQPFYSLVRVTDPYLRLFRNILPIFLGMDLSPLLAFLLIQIAMEAIPKLSTSI
jgi:YggT family protein